MVKRAILYCFIFLVVVLVLGQCELYTYLTKPNLHQSGLSSITVDPGTMSPAFSSRTTGYEVVVASGVGSITITPTAISPTATIEIMRDIGDWVTVASGSASPPLELTFGSGLFDVRVTAEDRETTTTYYVNVSD